MRGSVVERRSMFQIVVDGSGGEDGSESFDLSCWRDVFCEEVRSEGK